MLIIPQNVTKNRGGFGAYMAYGGVAAVASLPSIPILTAMQKASKISQQDSIDLGRAAKNAKRNRFSILCVGCCRNGIGYEGCS